MIVCWEVSVGRWVWGVDGEQQTDFFYLLGGFWAGQNSEVSAGAVILIDF